jgi:hypothetical protein
MPKLHPKSIRLSADDPRLGVLRYSWPWTLTVSALHTLATEPGELRTRLLGIDPEYFTLKEESFPEVADVRLNWRKVRALVTGASGLVEAQAAIQAAAPDALDQAAQAIWEIHRDFGRYMEEDES